MGIEKEIVEKKCENCGKAIFVYKEFVRDQMFCTLGCLDNRKRRDEILGCNVRVKDF